MTMANSTVASPMRSSAASLRKTNKPLMEKRRRARINDSLTQLKSLVITGTKKDSSQFNKLEKADILELTVKHLRNLQNHQQQLQQQQQQQHQLGSDATAMSPKYQDGFMECANEVIRYLNQAQGFSDDTKCRVVNHLANCIQLANTKATLAKQQAIQVQQIPSVPVNNTSTPANAAAATAVSASSIIGAPVPAPGQIIQIVSAASLPQASPVNGKPQNTVGNVQILPSPPSATPVNISPAPASSTNNVVPQQISIPNYAQPLHIQIPPAFSPILVPNNSLTLAQRQQQQQQQQQHIQPQQRQYPQPMDINMNQAAAPYVAKINPNTGSAFALNATQVPSRSVVMTAPESIPSPPQHPTTQEATTRQQQHCQQVRVKQEAPIMHVHKIHGFYSSAEDFVPSRPRTFSATSSSSSSTSSSTALMSPVDSDITCPLNLSQSPCKPAESCVPKPRHFMDKNNKKRLMGNQYQSLNTSPNNSDQENIPSNFNIMRSGEESSPPLGLRKALPENPTLKYMTMMMEEDRHCGRDQGLRSRSTSPASSVGEDRSLWRPW